MPERPSSPFLPSSPCFPGSPLMPGTPCSPWLPGRPKMIQKLAKQAFELHDIQIPGEP